MTPMLARIKRSVRAAIAHCGGIDGAAATAERRRSVAGDWNNLSGAVFPPLDCAFAMDEASLAQGRRAEILHSYAAELGHVAIRLPDAGAGAEQEALALIEVAEEVGQVASAVRDMLTDGVRERHERDRCAREIDDAVAKLTQLRAIVVGPVGGGAAASTDASEGLR